MKLWEELRSLVGNERGFIHKKLFGIGKGLVGAIPGIGTAITTATGVITALTAKGQQKQVALRTKFELPGTAVSIVGPPRTFVGPPPPVFAHPQDQGPCLPGLIRGPQGRCIAPTSPLGAKILVGQAVMGKYGAALIPGSQIIDRAVCLVGMQLGDDGLCYNKGNITNKQRMWPAGAKPLLTGGEMNAIRTASTARGRVAKAAARLGIVPQAPRKRRTPRGHKAKLVHA